MDFKIPNKLELVDTVLRDTASPIEFNKPEKNLHLADKMLSFMKENCGIGLAAPQCGLSVRLFVMQVGKRTTDILYCFNPEILSIGNMIATIDEGCLSFPNESVSVSRPALIHAKYQNYKGDWCETRLWGLSAICFQHELDHLNGIVMHDRENKNDRATAE